LARAVHPGPRMARTSKCMDAYMSEVRRRPRLTVEEEQDLARRYRATRDPQARRRLCEANLAFVVKKAHQLKRPHVPLEDLVQEGNLGILRAIESFDPDRGIRFLSYARYWIEAYMRRVLVRTHSIVVFGASGLQHRMYFMWEMLKRYRLQGRGGDLAEEDVNELAAFLKTSPDHLKQLAARLANRDVSLDKPLDDSSTAPLASVLPSDDDSPEDETLHGERLDRLKRAIADTAAYRLTPKERVVLNRRLACENPATLREVGEALGVSRERVRQIQCAVLKKLSAPMAAAAND
jgi:RNA polymerase sigma-32 factor